VKLYKVSYVFLTLLSLKVSLVLASSTREINSPLDVSQQFPLDINADHGIVCEQEKNICTATGNVVASYGEYILNCDTLIAYFRESKEKKTELWQVEAQGNVIIHSTLHHRKAYAQHGLYNLDTEHAILTKGNLSLEIDDLRVTARDSLEYFKKENKALAKGKAVATQKDQIIKADTLISYFKEGQSKKTQLHQVEAYKDVIIQSTTQPRMAQAQYGLYRVDTGYALLTGDNLKLEADDLIITARNSLEYLKNENIAFAKGQANATKEDRLIKGETLKAYFSTNKQGKQYVKKVEAFDNVLLSTPTEIVTADYGRYLKDEDFAILDGNVKISRADGQMEGQYAEVKLDTGISKMLNHSINSSEQTPSQEKRVHVLLLPRTKKKIKS
jgi:lipopolysaccharide export system protein LptA